MNFGVNMTDHNFMNLHPFGMFNSDLEREIYEESAPVNNGKMIPTLNMHLFTWPVLNKSIMTCFSKKMC
jgi:hypothetical protein